MAEPKHNRTVTILQQLAYEALYLALQIGEDVRQGEAEPEALDDALSDAGAALSLVDVVEFLELDPVSDLIEEAVERERTRPQRKRAAGPAQLKLVPDKGGSSSGSGTTH